MKTEYLNDKYYLVNSSGTLIYTKSSQKPIFIPEAYRKYYENYPK